jgi:electron transport complex protein RnfB
MAFAAGSVSACPNASCLKLKKHAIMEKKDKGYSRRNFINNGVRLALGVSVVGTAAFSMKGSVSGKDYVWQIDPFKCTQCGRCATECVKAESAVKCVHAYALCGYCDLCGGYLKPGARKETGAENQLCPTAAIQRKFIEEPYFEYIIDKELCIGCAKCVKDVRPSGTDPSTCRSCRISAELQPVFHCRQLSFRCHQPGFAR